MDFFQVKTRHRKGVLEVYPDFLVCKSKDLMIRGKSFYAIWDEEKGLWSQDEHDVRRFVDKELEEEASKLAGTTEDIISVKKMLGYSSNTWVTFKNYMNHMPDNLHVLDEKLTFNNSKVTKTDYVSKRLPYALEKGECKAWDELIGRLYSPEERQKLEWAIGAIVSGDSKSIQKFVVLYGDPGSGKGTVIEILQKLFDGYFTVFKAKSLTGNNDVFATEVFKSNPLVAFETDSKLSRIEDNTTLNSIVSHEIIPIHEKFKPTYMARLSSFLFLASNDPVQITNAKSGIIRRLIDISPTGDTFSPKKYSALMNQVNFELGHIAQHCLDIYRELGKNYYSSYRPIQMMFKTDVFFNFVDDNSMKFFENDGITLKAAYEIYKQYCEESGTESYRLPKYKFREEFKNYFDKFEEVTRIDGKQIRSYFSGFKADKFKQTLPNKEEHQYALVLDQDKSLLDIELASCLAQYASSSETPTRSWKSVKTTLNELDTHRLHYVKPPENMIVIDFDFKNESGEKDPDKNLEAASSWPVTYAEFSKGGGLHLHYYYDGDVSELSNIQGDSVECKVFTGGSSLRRKLTKCNNIPIETISEGLKKKEKYTKMIDFDQVRSEKSLRRLINQNLHKEIHPGTKPSIDFIVKILEDVYESGLHYDVSDMYMDILIFATNSTNHAIYCINKVKEMKFRGKEEDIRIKESLKNDDLVFFDVEVFPNLILVCWKFMDNENVVSMFNPTPTDIEDILTMNLVGFNCRQYDNHILYAILLGKTTEEIYEISKGIINDLPGYLFGQAYNLSKTDVYDFCSKKQSLKKWEIELGIPHKELGLRWDQPVPKEKWVEVSEYCKNDVRATEAVFKSRQADWKARKILADLTEMSVNDTTNTLSTRFIFGFEKNPQSSFNYRNLGDMPDGTYSFPWTKKDGTPDEYTVFTSGGRPVFPGYSYKGGKSEYRGEDPKEGGYVYAEPGFHGNVALLDIASMHPSSIVAENLFGDIYTKRFKEILDARIAIKHKDYDKARTMLGGKLAPYLDDEAESKDLAGALKIVINSVYGLTKAGFKNPFRDPRNIDNIVAKRGALFMVNLKHMVQDAGFTVAHIKTDSIKIPDATPEIIEKVIEYGKLYGYSFEHEATYNKMCLVNNAVYVAYSNENGDGWEWKAVGEQFQHPYVFKKLFTKKPIIFDDVCETKTVKTAIYLDFNEKLKEDEHDYAFIGKAGRFCPVVDGCGGGIMLREQELDDGTIKYHSVVGTKGYRWKESEVLRSLKKEDEVNYGYFDKLVDEAIKSISSHVDDVEWFCSEDIYTGPPHPEEDVPWNETDSRYDCPCGTRQYESCFDCPKFHPLDSVEPEDYLATTCDAGYSLEKMYNLN